MKLPASRSLRILHVLGSMAAAGGIQKWLMDILKLIDPKLYRMEVCVSNVHPSPYTEELRARGIELRLCQGQSDPPRFFRGFRALLGKHGPYDAVHSHFHYLSGAVMLAAVLERVPVRIVHSHLDTSAEDAAAGLVRRLQLRTAAGMIQGLATHRIAGSEAAGEALFGAGRLARRRWQVSRYGLDVAEFEGPIDRASVRAELGIPEDAFVIGHIGRFEEQKNHRFFLRVAFGVAEAQPNAHFLLIGDGSLHHEIRDLVRRSPHCPRFHFPGVRADLSPLLKSMDVFLFPSLYEGLPLILLQAQAAGVPSVLSNSITAEVDVHPSLVRRLSLRARLSEWVDAVLEAGQTTLWPGGSEPPFVAVQSRFHPGLSARYLEQCYDEARLRR